MPTIDEEPREIAPNLRVASLTPTLGHHRFLRDGERWRAQRDRDLIARLRMETGGSTLVTPNLGGAVEDLHGLAELARNLVHLDDA